MVVITLYESVAIWIFNVIKKFCPFLPRTCCFLDKKASQHPGFGISSGGFAIWCKWNGKSASRVDNMARYQSSPSYSFPLQSHGRGSGGFGKQALAYKLM